MMNVKALEEEALLLSPEDRAKLAQRLLVSLDELSEKEIENSCMDVASSRAVQIDRGEVDLIPSDLVEKKARAVVR